MKTSSTSSRGLRNCLIVFLLSLIILTAVIVTLVFTIFKPKDPEISVKPIGLENIQFPFSPNLTSNLSVEMEITVVNRNYGSFRYENSTGHVKYHDVVLADVPMETQTIPARSTTNMTTSAEFMVGRLISNPMFLSDLGNGTLNMTSMATLPGKVRMLNIFKMKATVSNTCHISLNVTSKAVTTKCISRIKM